MKSNTGLMGAERKLGSDQKPQEEEYRIVDTGLYLGMLTGLVAEGKDVPLVVTGGSMTPFMIHRRDSVLLSPIAGRKLRRGDIVLYLRDNGRYVMHRIVRVCRDGTYVLCGDAQTETEPGIRRDQILARAASVRRKGKVKRPGCFYWFFFAQIWSRLIPVRRLLFKAYDIIKRK